MVCSLLQLCHIWLVDRMRSKFELGPFSLSHSCFYLPLPDKTELLLTGTLCLNSINTTGWRAARLYWVKMPCSILELQC